MRASLLTTFFLLLTLSLQAQQTRQNPSTIQVNATGEVQVPADLIQFNIQVNAEGSSPQQVYDLHKKRETRLVELLKEYGIADDRIRYRPVSISSVNENRRTAGALSVRTSQQVYLTLEDFEVYERIQLGLIEADFDQFSGSFSSTRADSARDEALAQALAEARRKASLIAREAGVPLGRILEITYGGDSYPMERGMMMSEMAAGSADLMEFPQTVTLSSTVSIRFAIGRE